MIFVFSGAKWQVSPLVLSAPITPLLIHSKTIFMFQNASRHQEINLHSFKFVRESVITTYPLNKNSINMITEK